MDYELRIKEIGSRIREARKTANLSQEQLAELLDISTAYMSDIENGKTNLGIKIFMKITETLKVSADWLLQTNTPIVSDYHRNEFNDLLSDVSADDLRSYNIIIKEIKSLSASH